MRVPGEEAHVGRTGSTSLMLPRRPVTRLLVTLALIVGIAGCQSAPNGPIGGTVTVVGSWSGSEEQAFLAMVNPFERDSGITVEYKGTRDLNGLLWESVAKGTPPDVAGLPGPGQMAEFARHGSLKDLGATIDVSQYKADTVPTFIDLGTVDGKLVGVFIKASLKGLIWYNPNNFTLDPPTTWDDLERAANIARRDDIEDVVPLPGLCCNDRLAGHGLDRGHRAPPERSSGLRRLGRGPHPVDVAGDQERVRVLRRGRR